MMIIFLPLVLRDVSSFFKVTLQEEFWKYKVFCHYQCIFFGFRVIFLTAEKSWLYQGELYLWPSQIYSLTLKNLFRLSSVISFLVQDLKADFPVIKIRVTVYKDKYIYYIVYKEQEDKH